MSYVIAMFTHRPYVVSLVATFVIVALAERGWLRMTSWLVLGTFWGWLAEFVSTRTGFPFSWYEYYPASFPDELWLSNIPFFASLSFAALSYFGFSFVTTLLSPLRMGAHGLEREEDETRLLSLKVALLASLFITWMDFVVDPVAHLGEYWFLGKIYFYITKSAAWHFGIPLYNYGGWLLTTFTIIWTNQRLDAALTAHGLPPKPVFSLPHKSLWSLGYYVGNFIFMVCVSIYLYRSPLVPPERHAAGVLANTVAFACLFVVFNVTALYFKLRSPALRRAAA